MLEDTITERFSYDLLNRLINTSTSGLMGPVREQGYQYDVLGNLIDKTGIGQLHYDASRVNAVTSAGVHAVTRSGHHVYGYDAYGNMIQRNGETLDYDVFNKPTRIGNSHFSYGPDHARFKQVSGDTTTYYLAGGSYEEVIDSASSRIEKKSYLGGYLVQTDTFEAGTTTRGFTYLHTDHIGSVESMTDENGQLIARNSFDAWGQRQDANWESGIPELQQLYALPTTRGFTGHEMLDDTGLIHMNGRVYDPGLGRFLSPDILVQAPYNSQSFNRYTYVFNNPLSYTDPSGYSTNTGDQHCPCQDGGTVFPDQNPCHFFGDAGGHFFNDSAALGFDSAGLFVPQFYTDIQAAFFDYQFVGFTDDGYLFYKGGFLQEIDVSGVDGKLAKSSAVGTITGADILEVAIRGGKKALNDLLRGLMEAPKAAGVAITTGLVLLVFSPNTAMPEHDELVGNNFKTFTQEQAGTASSAKTKEGEKRDELVLVRHHTDYKGIDRIVVDNAINVARASYIGDKRVIGVHVEVAPFGDPRTAAEETGAFVENKLGNRAYVEFHVPRSQLLPTYVGPRRTAVIPHPGPQMSLDGTSPTFHKVRWWKFWE